MRWNSERWTSRGWRALGAAALLALLTAPACGPWPRDPEGTLARASGGTLRAGAAEAPPWITRSGDGAAGPEAELVEAFARSIGARVEWRWGAAEDHLAALERYELDVVAAGLTADSPWQRRVGLTRPWRGAGRTGRVLAVPPGENRTLVAIERRIEAHRRGAAP